MFKVIQYKYNPTKKERRLLRLLCHISKNLYNSALYILRQEYFKNKKVISYFDLNKILKTNENFHILNTYTSICSFYDHEEIKYHKYYQGKRITRSLFKTKTGKIINADINAALNILAKCKTERCGLISILRNRGQTIPLIQKIKLN